MWLRMAEDLIRMVCSGVVGICDIDAELFGVDVGREVRQGITRKREGERRVGGM
jgi:hypothetical protein